MRTHKRSRQQLEKTSHWRHEVFKFMKRFDSKHLWTIDGPPDTDVDEMLCFAYSVDDGLGGVAIIQTWIHGGWDIYTSPCNDGDLDVLQREIEAQAIMRNDMAPTAEHQRSRAAIALMLALKGALVVIDEEIEEGNGLAYEQDNLDALTKLSENAHKAIAYAEGKLLSSISDLITREQLLGDPVGRYWTGADRGAIEGVSPVKTYLVDGPLHPSKALKEEIEARGGLPVTAIEEVPLDLAGKPYVAMPGKFHGPEIVRIMIADGAIATDGDSDPHDK